MTIRAGCAHVIVLLADDVPGGRLRREKSIREKLATVHIPDLRDAGGITPEDVVAAVAVEVPGALDVPDAGVAGAQDRRVDDLRAVHQPQVDRPSSRGATGCLPCRRR